MTIMSAKNFSGNWDIRETGIRGNDIRDTDFQGKVVQSPNSAPRRTIKKS